MALESAKKVAAEFALDKAIKYLHKDPEKNLFTILNYLQHAAVEPYHKEWMKSLKNYFSQNPQALMQAKRVASNDKMLYRFIDSLVLNGTFFGKPKREKIANEIGVSVPAAILIDPTYACNLKCDGCWAGEYSKADSLEPELLNRIITEAKEMGIHWIVFSGGEPLCYPYLTDILKEHTDSFFLSFTNGTLIDEKLADQLAELGNFSPAFSLEGNREYTDARRGAGTFDKITKAMDLLRERGVFFGASVTAMSNNLDNLFSDEFIDYLIEKGVLYMWSFHYLPIGRNPDIKMMLTPEQRLWMVDRFQELRKSKPMLMIDFWNDGEYTGGCIAGGRQYFHINASGDVEPCAFVHFAEENIKDKSLRQVLQNPLFKAYQQEVPFNDNHLAPCPIIDNPDKLHKMVSVCGAHPTHRGAEQIFYNEEVARHLQKLSQEWKQKATEKQD